MVASKGAILSLVAGALGATSGLLAKLALETCHKHSQIYHIRQGLMITYHAWNYQLYL